MGAVIEFLQGKKTYILAASSMLGALAAYLDGTMTASQAIQLAVTALIGASIRSGINTTTQSTGDKK